MLRLIEVRGERGTMYLVTSVLNRQQLSSVVGVEGTVPTRHAAGELQRG